MGDIVSEEIRMQKDEKLIIQSGKPESWVKAILFLISGAIGMFGYQKMPIINQSTKIAESVETVKNLSPEELAGLRGLQFLSLEKQMQERNEITLAAIGELKTELRTSLREYDERSSKRLDKNEGLILTNIKAIARLEALIPKARASKND